MCSRIDNKGRPEIKNFTAGVFFLSFIETACPWKILFFSSQNYPFPFRNPAPTPLIIATDAAGSVSGRGKPPSFRMIPAIFPPHCVGSAPGGDAGMGEGPCALFLSFLMSCCFSKDRVDNVDAFFVHLRFTLTISVLRVFSKSSFGRGKRWFRRTEMPRLLSLV